MAHALLLRDQVYTVFRKLKSSTLSFEAIREGLSHHFSNHHVDERDIERLRFLYFSGKDDYTLSLKPDDICPNGFNCRKDHIACGRLHVAIKDHICRHHFNSETMWCQNTKCRLVHLPRSKIRDMILSVILVIYARRRKDNANLLLRGMTISDDELIACYLRIFGSSPVPKMSHSSMEAGGGRI